MRRSAFIFVFALPLLIGPAYALQGKSASAPGQVKKKAHADIKKWVKAKKRKVKIEIKFYDDLVRWGVPSKDAMKTIKIVIEHNLDLGHLSHYARRRANAGVRGKVLHETIHREVKAKAEKKKKEKAKKAGPKKPPGKHKGKKGK